MQFILTDKDEINSKDKDFIEELKELSKQEEECFFVFDNKDITIKIDIDEVKMKMPKQKYYSKVDAKINNEIMPENIIKKLEQIPKHLEVRLETNSINQITELMNSEILIEKLKEMGINFLHKGIEIEPRIIESKMDEDDLKNELKVKEAKRARLDIDWDK